MPAYAQEVEAGEVMEDSPAVDAPADALAKPPAEIGKSTGKSLAKPSDKKIPAGDARPGDQKEGSPPQAAVSAVPSQPAPDAAAVQEESQSPYDSVVLRGLNKVTARISSFPAPLGTVVRFGNLEIIARRCWRAPPDEQPENAALLEVWELKPGEGPQRIFLGWMFSSSPAISALEHPVYDITVTECVRQNEQGEPQ